ncbi:MAG: hypothetical protein V4724_14535 [Pseudomonadota bacterium]
MATIVIKDLAENTELDRQAMIAISGGARFRVSSAVAGRTALQRLRLFDIAASGVARTPAGRPPSR